jgi:hypothetical protein
VRRVLPGLIYTLKDHMSDSFPCPESVPGPSDRLKLKQSDKGYQPRTPGTTATDEARGRQWAKPDPSPESRHFHNDPPSTELSLTLRTNPLGLLWGKALYVKFCAQMWFKWPQIHSLITSIYRKKKQRLLSLPMNMLVGSSRGDIWT